MFHNYLSAALGNIGRNGVYAGITILGLAVSFAAAILIGLYLRDEFTFEHVVPGHKDVYRIEQTLTLPGQKPSSDEFSGTHDDQKFKLDFPETQAVARIQPWGVVLKRGAVELQQEVMWADPDFFKVMPYPVLAGDPNAALAAPDGLVLTLSAARKYFGEDAPIGKVLQLHPNFDVTGGPPAFVTLLSSYHPMRVMAVIKDLPSNTHLNVQVFGSGRAPFSLIALDELRNDPYSSLELTYVRLKPGSNIEDVRARLPAFDQRHWAPKGVTILHHHLVPLGSIHFNKANLLANGAIRMGGNAKVDAGVAGEGLLIVLIAAINFVTLMTARASRRAVEVGVRKAAGARRGELVVQFMGEALVYVLIAMALAVVLAELSLPGMNAVLRRTMAFDYLADPWLVAAIAGGTLLTAALAGLYPALVLSAFRPATALKGGSVAPAGSPMARQALVTVQFSIVIGLMLVTATVYRQTQFALHDALRLNTDEVVSMMAPCRSAFHDGLRTLPGIRSVSCAAQSAVSTGGYPTTIVRPDRSQLRLEGSPIDVGFFELHGLKPIAGRFFSAAQGPDMVLRKPVPGPYPDLQPTVVLNEGGARALGYAHPADAVGKMVTWGRISSARGRGLPLVPVPRPSQIVGVVGDFTLASVHDAIKPSIYYVEPDDTRYILAKLDGSATPDTIKAIAALWRRTGQIRPLDWVFERTVVQNGFQDVILQGELIAACAGLALVIACLGLFALAAFVTERRTKEIGVRKAMGASAGDVVRLLLWQFSQPVLWANLIAWPAAFFAMDWWLHGFAYRVGQPLWLFAGAAVAAALVAWATVSVQSWMVARAKPATALRYE
jgi:putative ABC transport system permease protein